MRRTPIVLLTAALATISHTTPAASDPPALTVLHLGQIASRTSPRSRTPSPTRSSNPTSRSPPTNPDWADAAAHDVSLSRRRRRRHLLRLDARPAARPGTTAPSRDHQGSRRRLGPRVRPGRRVGPDGSVYCRSCRSPRLAERVTVSRSTDGRQDVRPARDAHYSDS